VVIVGSENANGDEDGDASTASSRPDQMSGDERRGNGLWEWVPIAMPVTCPLPNLHWHKSNAPIELTMESLHANELTRTRSNPSRNSQ